ncbi:branched-chain amino acid transport system / permease component family protein [Clostridioides difficile Y358]|nr:branched-chain amino acid transport system / permease component family protein [Clostridioides difficile]EQI70908.1 branched-chain amino acid transport system / permease component family protein [Clostridioides difficile Y358]
MGASIVAFSLTNGISPVVATLMAILCGCTAGLVTGILHIKFKISNLLSGILVMGMLYSINLRIMENQIFLYLALNTYSMGKYLL